MSAAGQMQANVLKLRENQPPPAWRSNLGEHGADWIVNLGDRVLVSTMYGEPSYYTRSFGLAAPHYGPLVLVEASSGRPLWRKDRRDRPCDVVAVEPVIVLHSQDENGAVLFEGLDRTTGVTLWTHEARADQAFAATASPPELVIAAKSGDDLVRVRTVGLADGRGRWSRTVPGAKGPAGAAMLLQAGPILIVLGDTVSALESASGEVLWRAALPGQCSLATKAVVDGDGLYLSTGANLALLSLREGKLLWQQPLEGEPDVLSPSSDAVLVVSSSDNGSVVAGWLHAFDPKTGRPRWSHALSAPLHSVPLSTPRAVYYTTASGLVGVNMATGAQLFSTPWDTPGTSDELPDLLLVRGKTVVVARETGIWAYAAQNGTAVWAVSDFGGNNYVRAHALEGMRGAAQLGGDPALAQKAATGTAAVVTMPLGQRGPPGYVQMAQERWRSTRASRTSTAGERMRAADYAQHVTKSYQGAMRTQATIGVVGAGVAAAVAVFGAMYGAYKAKETFETIAQRWAIAATQAAAFHFSSISGGLYVRPFRRAEGAGLKVVDLDTGNAADLYLTPGLVRSDFISTLDLQPPLYAVADDQQTLYVVGTGLNPAQAPKYQWRVGYTEWEVPYPCILSYDLRQLHYVDVRAARLERDKAKQAQQAQQAQQTQQAWQSHHGGLAPTGKQDLGLTAELFAAIMKNDLAAASDLLKKGADPNAEMSTMPLLVLAVGGHHADAVKLLLEFGADPNLSYLNVSIVETARQQGDSEIVRLLMQARNARAGRGALAPSPGDN